jgi:hypothetical protein
MILGLIWLGLQGSRAHSFRLPLSIALNLSFFCTFMVYLLENPNSDGQNPQANWLLFFTLLQDGITLLFLLTMKKPADKAAVTNADPAQEDQAPDFPAEEL